LVDEEFDLFVAEEYRTTIPTTAESIYYLFWEKGIGYNQFKDLPLPYIFKIIKTHNWVKSEEEKAQKKANRKK